MFKAVEWGEFMRGSIANCETQAEKTVLAEATETMTRTEDR